MPARPSIQRTVAAICNLKAVPEPPDVADAIAIAWTLGMQLIKESFQ